MTENEKPGSSEKEPEMIELDDEQASQVKGGLCTNEVIKDVQVSVKPLGLNTKG